MNERTAAVLAFIRINPGCSPRDISEALDISPNSARAPLDSLYAKHQLVNRTGDLHGLPIFRYYAAWPEATS